MVVINAQMEKDCACVLVDHRSGLQARVLEPMVAMAVRVEGGVAADDLQGLPRAAASVAKPPHPSHALSLLQVARYEPASDPHQAVRLPPPPVVHVFCSENARDKCETLAFNRSGCPFLVQTCANWETLSYGSTRVQL